MADVRCFFLLNSSEHQPAFVHAYEYLRGHKLGVIKLNPGVAQRLSRDSVRETIHPRQLPMLTKPRPWINVEDGGYLTTKSNYFLSRWPSLAWVADHELV